MSRQIDENAIIKMLNTIDRYTSEELTLCDTDKTFPKNEVFIVDDVFEGLDELPSAQPERKTGRWINAQYPFSRCNQCGAYVDTVNNEANYCCVCGAKMEAQRC